jgi:hypothetical protein
MESPFLQEYFGRDGHGYMSHSPLPLDANGVAINMPTNGSVTPAQYHSDNETSSESRMNSVEVDVCFPTPNKKEEGGIDFESLEEFVTSEKKELAERRVESKSHRRRLSTMGNADGRRYSMYGARMMVNTTTFF